jgi:hypothetical protein
MLVGRLGGPRNALIAMAAFAIIIAGHQFSLRWHGPIFCRDRDSAVFPETTKQLRRLARSCNFV